jgi:hypothetical protein
VTITNAVKQKEYASGALEFLMNDPCLSIALTADDFKTIYGQSEAQTIGAKFGTAIVHSMDKLFIRELIRNTDIPFKDFFRDQLTQTIRVIGTHNFIVDVLGKESPDPELVIYSQARLDKVMAKLNEWAGNTTKTALSAPPPVKPTGSKLNHPLEAVSAMREMRSLIDTVKISVFDFNEEKIRKSSTLPNGTIDYRMVAAQLRHNHTNYDVLRVSRKIRRNTYWKITAHTAIRIAVCEKLLLMTEDSALHFRLMYEIELANAEFQKKLATVAKSPNFTAAIDDMYIRVTKKKVFKRQKCNFMLCLETI